MGNCYMGISDAKLDDAFKTILKFGYMREDQVRFQNVNINQDLARIQEEYNQEFEQLLTKQNGGRDPGDRDPNIKYQSKQLWAPGHQENYIFQADFSSSDLSINDDENAPARKQKPRLVLIHGYGATGLMFYRCVDLLRREFRLTTIDLLGMGGSGRPPYIVKSSRDSVSFFIHSVEAWMRSQERANNAINGAQESEQIILMGHSLGAFVSAHYALRYPQRVKQLILCSPVGFPEAPPEATLQERINRETSYTRKFAVGRIGKMWDDHTSPFSLLRATGTLGASSLLNNYVSRRMGISDKQEQDALKNLLHQCLMRPMSSDVAITMVLKLGAYAREPLLHQVHQLQMKVNFMYGESDWMSRTSADALLKDGKLKPGSSCVTIPQAGHQHLNDNPLSTAVHAIGLIHGPQKVVEYEQHIGQNQMKMVQMYGPRRVALY